MKFLILISVFFVSTGNAYLTRNLPVRFCAVMKDWKQDTFSPKELCQKHGGSFCPSIENMGQAICAAAGGTFCSSAKSTGEGICRAGNGSFCSGIQNEVSGLCAALGGSYCEKSSEERRDLLQRLEQACGT